MEKAMGKRVALLVGINDYGKGGLSELRYAEADAELLGKALEDVGGFTTKLLLGKQATIDGITNALRTFYEDFEEIDLFVFYFAGHGESIPKTDQHCLHCYGSECGDTVNTLETTEWVNRIKRRFIKSDIIIILDACRNHLLRKGRGRDNKGLPHSLRDGLKEISVRSLEEKPSLDEKMPTPRYIFTLLSCQVNQVSYEDDDWMHGIFTYALVKEIKENGNRLPLGELIPRVGAITYRRCFTNNFPDYQQPEWIAPAITHDVYITGSFQMNPILENFPDKISSTPSKIKSSRAISSFRISEKQLDEIKLIQENLSSDLSSLLSFYLTSQVDVRLASIEELTYSEMLDRLPSPTYINVLSMEPFNEHSLLEISPSILFPMLDILNGGSVHFSDTSLSPENVDKGLTGGLVKTILEGFQEGWTALNSLKMSVIQTETLPRDLAVLSLSQNILSISFELAMGMPKGLMHFCLPHTLLKEIHP
jgi:hypothetical protein